MSYLTLASVRETLWKYARGANDTAVAYADRTNADTAAFDSSLAQVCQRFFTGGKWRGMVASAVFPVYEETITLPSSLETVLGANPMDADYDVTSSPLALYSQWYRFTGSGEGRLSGCAYRGLIDLGDWFATFRDPLDPFYVKAVAEVSETSKTILLRGADENGKVIYSGASTEGVSLDINFASAQTTTQEFTNLSYWVKNGTTNGVVRLYAVDVDTAEETLIAIITPSKTVSGYRRYRVPPGINWLEVIAKRAFVPMVADADPVIPSNIGALKHGLRAVRFEDASDDDRALVAWGNAYRELDNELQEFQGDATLTPIQCIGDFGAGSVPTLY